MKKARANARAFRILHTTQKKRATMGPLLLTTFLSEALESTNQYSVRELHRC